MSKKVFIRVSRDGHVLVERVQTSVETPVVMREPDGCERVRDGCERPAELCPTRATSEEAGGEAAINRKLLVLRPVCARWPRMQGPAAADPG